MGTYKIALNQRAIAKLQQHGANIAGQETLRKDDKVSPVPGLDLVELDKALVRDLDRRRKIGETYSHTILHGWPR